MRRIVRYESVITALIGAALGLTVGFVPRRRDHGRARGRGLHPVDPVVSLIVFAILAVVAGVLAAIPPARRASRLNVLERVGVRVGRPRPAAADRPASAARDRPPGAHPRASGSLRARMPSADHVRRGPRARRADRPRRHRAAGRRRLEVRQDDFGESTDMCSLVNAKSGGCAEDCGFCAQSKYADAETPMHAMMEPEQILEHARAAEAAGRAPLLHGHAGPGPLQARLRQGPGGRAAGGGAHQPEALRRRSATCRPSARGS